MDDIESAAAAVLRNYPRIYFACHIDHRRRRGQGPAASARDQTILAHVPDEGVRQQSLGGHLDLAPSTVSEALKRLEALGLISLEADPEDARGNVVRLTSDGRAAIAEASVLDICRVQAALARLNEAERRTVVRGLSLLADAAHGRA